MTKREVSDLVTVVITNCDWPEWKRVETQICESRMAECQ